MKRERTVMKHHDHYTVHRYTLGRFAAVVTDWGRKRWISVNIEVRR